MGGEWFRPGGADGAPVAPEPRWTPQRVPPVEGWRVALDPRVPAPQQALEFQLDGAVPAGAAVDWFVDGQRFGCDAAQPCRWPLARGEHEVWAKGDGGAWRTALVHFHVR